MARLAKTLSTIGGYFLISSIVPLMCLSVFMMSIKKIAVSSLRNIAFIGEWLATLVEENFSAIESLGIGMFFILLGVIGVTTTFLVFINLRKAFIQRIGYLMGIVFGGLLIFASAIPFFVSKASADDGIWVLITGFLFTFCGLSGLFVTSGSILGFLWARTEMNNVEKKYKFSKKFKQSLN
ncbi:hypothetical protein SLITO_v1c08120 [Spiroplasma litorale]|uniref:Uncharacterized protein n=1 Tax=Spiroplasma litorale TaxID=216942 RepID=A0A0K1W2M7_9MOLU|nr:hypothetical protein [Spiroplasma litorale]AKX34431.1 hypothetical protein SLITO_v1c08120 [Spiroplasma litorale]